IVAGALGRREADRERAEAGKRGPALLADELVERGVQLRCVGGGAERRVAAVGDADDRLGPGRRVGRVAAGSGPEDGAALVRDVARERVIDTDEAVADE